MIPLPPLALNGATAHGETCLLWCVRTSGHWDVRHWEAVLRRCHVPAHSPAAEWTTALQRVLWCGTEDPFPPRTP